MSENSIKNHRKTTTIQISLKTRDFLDEVKQKEQISSYDAVIRIILLNYKLFIELDKKEKIIKNLNDIKTNSNSYSHNIEKENPIS